MIIFQWKKFYPLEDDVNKKISINTIMGFIISFIVLAKHSAIDLSH